MMMMMMVVVVVVWMNHRAQCLSQTSFRWRLEIIAVSVMFGRLVTPSCPSRCTQNWTTSVFNRPRLQSTFVVNKQTDERSLVGECGRAVAKFFQVHSLAKSPPGKNPYIFWRLSEFPLNAAQNRPSQSLCSKNELDLFSRFDTIPAMNSLLCTDVPLRNCSLRDTKRQAQAHS